VNGAAGVQLDQVMVLDLLRSMLDEFNDGVGRRSLLDRLVASAEAFGGAAGACFSVVEPDGGRVLVTSGSCAWMQGRHFPWEGTAIAALMAGGRRSDVFLIDDTGPSVRADVASRGLRSALLARATATGRTVGALYVFYRQPEPPVDDVRRAVLELIASACGVLIEGAGGTVTTEPPGLPARETVDGHATTVAASIADGLAVLGSDATVRSWNRSARHLTGLPREAVLHRPPPFPVPEPGQVLDHRLDSGRWIQILCSALGGSGERVVTFRDVTRPKLDEEAKDLFLATTSHELRTPVTVVKGYADTLLDRWPDLDQEARLAAVRVIQQRSGQLADLVERLLLGAKPTDAAVRVVTEPFDLAEAVRDATAGLLDASPRHRLVVALPAGLPLARGDRVSMGTVLSELVSNAAKYSPDGGDITVTGGHDATTVMFRVGDRGIGVPPDDVERVFDRFWQAEIGDQRRFGGVGLGLYIVRRLIDRQHGWVVLRPRAGGGTAVEVRLPRADAAGWP
jgi:two-component system phosphate regulon sensor histidine kinase PhoR